MSTSVKIVCSWLVALGTGLLLRRLLPELRGVLIRGKMAHFLGYNRLAFWACLLAGILATIVILTRAMLRDLGIK